MFSIICLEEIMICNVLIESAKSTVIKYIIKGINPFVAYCKKTALNQILRGKRREMIFGKIFFVKQHLSFPLYFIAVKGQWKKIKTKSL